MEDDSYTIHEEWRIDQPWCSDEKKMEEDERGQTYLRMMWVYSHKKHNAEQSEQIRIPTYSPTSLYLYLASSVCTDESILLGCKPLDVNLPRRGREYRFRKTMFIVFLSIETIYTHLSFSSADGHPQSTHWSWGIMTHNSSLDSVLRLSV